MMGMKLRAGFLAAAAGVVLFGGQAMAEVPPALAQLLPAPLAPEVSRVTTEKGVTSIGRVRFQGEGFDVIVNDARIEITPAGQAAFSFSTAGIVPLALGDPGLMLSRGQITFSGRPANHDICSWAAAIVGLQAEAALITPSQEAIADDRRREIPDTSYRIDLAGMSYERAPSPDCAAIGKLGARLGSIRTQGGKNYRANDIDAEINIPLMAGRVLEGSRAGVKAIFREFEYAHLKEIPSVGLAKARVDLDLDARSLDGLLEVIRGQRPYVGTIDPTYFGLQVYNAMTMVEGKLRADAPVLRIYAPGVFPSEAVSNFSRAGLSTMTGEAKVTAAIDRGVMDMGGQVKVIGLGEIALSKASSFHPYSAQIFEALRQGIDIGFHVVPDWRLGAARMTFTDQGFNESISLITGASAARYAEELGTRLLQGKDGRSLEIGTDVLRGLTEYLRSVASGDAVTTTLQPADAVPVSQMLVMAIRDFEAFKSFINMKYVTES